MKIKLTVEYNGVAFSGWQKQTDLRTVEGELSNALQIFISSQGKEVGIETIETPIISGSGRTDAGVHAKAQVASFRWPDEIPCNLERLKSALNGITGRELAVLSAEKVKDDFDARHSPHLKCYRYSLLLRESNTALYEGMAWAVGNKLDIPKMILAARAFIGQRDYSSFRASDCTAATTVRTIMGSEMSRITPELLSYTVIGKGFLKQMVRIMVGTIAEIGKGVRPVEDIERLLEIKDRKQAGQTAPAYGLTLEWVKYLDKDFY